jgi:hypothetical protein
MWDSVATFEVVVSLDTWILTRCAQVYDRVKGGLSNGFPKDIFCGMEVHDGLSCVGDRAYENEDVQVCRYSNS